MDNFMSKLSQRINTQDTIKANFMADMAEKEQLKKQLQEYELLLQGMRNLYLKQEETLGKLEQAAEKLQLPEENEHGAALAEQEAKLTELKELISKSDEFTHKECVKVYRNVQALLEEQNKKLAESTELVNAQIEKCKAAVLTGELADLKHSLNVAMKGIRANRVWIVVAAVLGLAELACTLLIHFGLL